MKKKRNNGCKRLLAALLALTLCLSLCPAAFAAEKNVSIGTAEELADFAARCALDDYSKDLTVVLTADIDLKGEAASIPIFLGSFDGQGHKLTGLKLTESNSVYGLFSRVASGAVVKNLTVEGEVDPDGTQSKVGGIAGENGGSIENCRFSGVVVGESSVGGIAGSNNGSITDCAVSGVVRGTQYTGGIAGQNAGTLLRCTSASAVNTTVSEADIAAAELENLESNIYSLLKNEEVTETAVTTDSGGIAGYSTGVIQSCTNTGSVGYQHVGYNVGGIAGRQNGYLASCVNRGEVQGRKDVGGIVGQMAPDITLQFSENGLDELQSELNALQSLIDRTLSDAQTASDSVSSRMSRISTFADSAKDNARSLTDQLSDFTDDNIGTVNGLMLLVERYLAKFVPIADDVSDASDSMTESVVQLRQLLAELKGTLQYNDEVLAQLGSFCDEMKAACNAIDAGIDALEKAFSLMADGPAMPDTGILRADTAKLLSALNALSISIDEARREYEDTGNVSAETPEKLNADLETVLDAYSAVISDLDDLVNNTDFGALRDESEAALHEILDALQTAMDQFHSAAEHFGTAMGHLRAMLDTLRALNAQLDRIFAQLDTVMQSVQRAASSLASALGKAADWVRNLSGEDPGSFSQLGQKFDESSDALNESLSGISNELSALNGEMDASNTLLLSDVRAVNSQFMKVMNLFLNVLNDTQNVDYTDVFEDVSEESLQSAVRGKVLECTNYGAVTADRNAGGVAGAMAIEYDTDPEDDLLSSDDRSLRFTYQTKAILLDCDNYGSVQAKKSCAGGITGRMDLGTVSGCGGWGSVTSESGDYVGGVAGLSLSSIRESYAKCTLSGGKYVGGIAGSGKNMSGCASMVEITDCTQLGGAVAGEITGDYAGNRFVSDDLAGVDRVSLSGKAEKLSYDALCGMEDIPDNFRRLTLRFVADGEVLREQEFNYGASFTDEIYPTAPEKEDCYVRWDRTDLSDLHFDTTVTAEYEPYVTTLASKTGEETLLVEGKFREGDSLRAEKTDDLSAAPNGAIEAWTLQIPDDGQESHTVRWPLPADGAGDYTVYIEDENGWHKVSGEAVGSYLCFELAGGTFAVVPTSHSVWWVWMLMIAAAATGGILLWRHSRSAKKKER